MQQIASTGRFRHRHDVFGIYASALKQGCVVVCIANGKCDERQEQAENDKGSRTAHMHLRNRCNQFTVRLHMIADAELNQPSQNRVGEKKNQENCKVNCRNAEEQHSFSLLAVVKLTKSWNDRQHGCHVRIFGWMR